MNVYLEAKQIEGKNFRVLSTEAKVNYRTTYDYWKKNSKHLKGLIIKDEEENKYKIWKEGKFEKLDMEIWYDEPIVDKEGNKVLDSDGNQKTKKKSYLQDWYTYPCEFEKKESVPIWDKDSKSMIEKETEKFFLKLNYVQNKVLVDALSENGTGINFYYVITKDGKSYRPIPKKPIELNQDEKTVPELKPMKKSVSEFTSQEEGFLKTAREEKLTKDEFKEWLVENKATIKISDEKIEKLVSVL